MQMALSYQVKLGLGTTQQTWFVLLYKSATKSELRLCCLGKHSTLETYIAVTSGMMV